MAGSRNDHDNDNDSIRSLNELIRDPTRISRAKPWIDSGTLQRKLLDTYGKGDNPNASQRVYERLARAVEEYGMQAYHQLLDVARWAKRTPNPGKSFRVACPERFRRLGFMSEKNFSGKMQA